MTQMMKMVPDPKIIGQFRTFGPVGPTYKILAFVQPINSSDWLLRIQILETGEETEYRYTRILNDPEVS
jgi:hypothetical protein